MNILKATRLAFKLVKDHATDKRIEKALNLLGYNGEEVHNYALACYDSPSVLESVRQFINEVK